MNKITLNPVKAVSNFIKSCRKYGYKETMKKWKYNYLMLETPEGLIKKRIIGYIGGIFGIVFAIIVFIRRGFWFITIAMGFSVLIMYANLKGDLKQLQVLKDLKEQFKEVKK
jgi:hypothetical protein